MNVINKNIFNFIRNLWNNVINEVKLRVVELIFFLEIIDNNKVKRNYILVVF